GPDAPHTDEVPLAVALELARLAWRKAPIAGELDGVVGHGAGAHGGDAVVDDSVAVVVEVVALLRLRADVADAIESSAHTGERARHAKTLDRAADHATLEPVPFIDGAVADVVAPVADLCRRHRLPGADAAVRAISLKRACPARRAERAGVVAVATGR